MYDLIQGDCLVEMPKIKDQSIDLILCDLPYGVTAKNKWDTIIPFDKLWKQYVRIIKDNGAIVLFGQDKFTAKLMLSNEKYHRYNLIWNKVLPSGFLNAGRMPLREHEDVCIFYKSLPTYNPQKIKGNPCHKKGKAVGKMNDDILKNDNYQNFKVVETEGDMKFPTSILTFSKTHPSKALHPTEKPVALLEWLIRTYTNKNELVLDNCMGSGSTGIACLNTNRNFIGIELDEKYYNVAKNRLEEHDKKRILS
ncbi:MAG: site-specific DNA-methyltransferase [Candidatus Izemoplasmatales bacterium]|nr:site-specific DNA-methyltransferase [Candidatus Izemoplasmatales bacterium]